MPSDARRAARRANDHPVLETGARLGYAASGLVHLVLGWLVLRLAAGGPADQADQTGALTAVASTGWGTAVGWVVLVGFVLLAGWQVTEAVLRSGTDRLKASAKAVVHGSLAATAWSVLRGAAGDADAQVGTLTARLMGAPSGRWLVAALGAAVVVVGGYHVVKGLSAGFLADLREQPPRWVARLARLGYVAKGVALAAVGSLFLAAAVRLDPGQAGGLDDALRTLLGLPAGRVVVTAIGVGLACYGGYSLARARYARV